MCGIAGVFEYGLTAGGVSEDILLSMQATLRHRGPDGDGIYLSTDRRLGLAHRRLAIIDIEAGAQPMRGPDGTWLVFNGEIYNYPQLRESLIADGVQFETRCDTEVILHLYRRHGEQCVDHLTGMFAFALWDPHRESLFFARDPIGEKPFYWCQRNGVFVFGSEIKALLEHPATPREVNRDAIGPYLTHLVTPGPETLYSGINKLAPGHLGRCDADGVHIRQFWSATSPREWSATTVEEATIRVRELLEESVQARLMSDVPLGVLLSGGVDSTTIVALLRDQGSALNTYTVGFPGYDDFDERAEARWTARHFGTTHHEIELTEADAVASFPTLIHHQDEPLADPTCLPLRAACERARETGVKVLLAGEGSDELFWGYEGFSRTIARFPRLAAMLRMPWPVRKAAALATSPSRRAHRRERLDGLADGRVRPMHMPLGLTGSERKRLLLAGPYGPGWSPSPATEDDALSTFGFDTQEHEFTVRLPELLLMRTDRFSMASSIEARVPFLDRALVDYVYRLPIDLKVRSGVAKFILKHAMRDILPERVSQRRKQGFTPPTSHWFGGRYGRVLHELIGQDTLRQYFDTDYLRRVVAGANPQSWESGHFLWPVLNFGLWHKYWIEGDTLEGLVAESETHAGRYPPMGLPATSS
jgi:asparagine synthase (glutamine-hydrolysing)